MAHKGGIPHKPRQLTKTEKLNIVRERMDLGDRLRPYGGDVPDEIRNQIDSFELVKPPKKNNRGLRSDRFVKEIKKKGSIALPDRVSRKKIKPPIIKEEEDLKPITNDEIKAEIIKLDGEGVISGKLQRPKYLENELVKAIDTEIKELLPRTKTEGPPTVLRSIYEDALDEIDSLNRDKLDLESIISQLRSEISGLETEIESLNVSIDGESLRADTADNQATIASENVADTTLDLQNAIQNATQEAIQRVSLTAQNEALRQEIKGLREQLGLAEQSKLSVEQALIQQAQRTQEQAQQTAAIATQAAAGATFLGSGVSIRNTNKPSDNNYDIEMTGTVKGGAPKSIKGDKWEVTNNGKSVISVNARVTKQPNGVSGLLKVSPSSQQVQPGGKVTVTVSVDSGKWGSVKPKKKNLFTRSQTHEGTIQFTAGSETIDAKVKVRKNKK